MCIDANPAAIESLQAHGDTRAMVASGLNLPFKNKSFDYVACLHFAEHCQKDELQKLFSEMERVAPRGYVEVPGIYWELLYNGDTDVASIESAHDTPHWYYIFFDNSTLHFIRKPKTADPTHKILNRLFEQIINPAVTADNIDLFMIGYEWQGNIRYQYHESLSTIPKELYKNIIAGINEYVASHLRPSKTKAYIAHVIKKLYEH